MIKNLIISTFVLTILPYGIFEPGKNYDPEMPQMRYVQGGTFNMGGKCPPIAGRERDECPTHVITVPDFNISETETTVRQYRAFCHATGKRMPQEPEWGWQDDYPVVGVNHFDAQVYIGWLNEVVGPGHRLPTEAEWEYAARGGIESEDREYAGSDDLDEVGWHKDNSGRMVAPVRSKKPNELGLYDMSGNVMEWCDDWYDAHYYEVSETDNPQGPSSPRTGKVVRGGSWREVPYRCRAVYRYHYPPDMTLPYVGFRVVREISAMDDTGHNDRKSIPRKS